MLKKSDSHAGFTLLPGGIRCTFCHGIAVQFPVGSLKPLFLKNKTLSEDKAGYQKRLHEIQKELRELKTVSEQLKIAASNIHVILGHTKERPFAKESLMEH